MSSEQPLREKYRNSLKVPLIVGITGHLDIKDPESVKKRLGVFWEAVQKMTGNDTSIILLTSIARGADHLTTRSCPENVRYCVVMPFAEEAYRKDFKGQTLTEFEEDLRGAYKVIQCDAEPGDYAVASDYVRKHCDILLTMWDGYETLNVQTRMPEKGGTYYQIREAFCMDDLLLHHPEKKHLIVNISVERSEKGTDHHRKNGEKQICSFPEGSGLSVVTCDLETKKMKASDFLEWERNLQKQCDEKRVEQHAVGSGIFEDFSDVLTFLRFHNGTVKNVEPLPRKENVEKREKPYYLRRRMQKSDEGVKAMSVVEEDFDRHEYFDHLATTHQVSHKNQFFRVALFSIFIGILGQLWGDVTFHKDPYYSEWIMHGVILLYLAGCAGLFWYAGKIKRENHYSLYLQPRIVAEMLRLRMFWKLTGIQESFTDYILAGNTGCWVELLICNWDVADPHWSDATCKWVAEGGGIGAVKSFWLEDQREYYKGYLLPDQKHFILPQNGEACRERKFASKKWREDYFKKYERLERYASCLKTFFTWSAFVLSLLLIFVFLDTPKKGIEEQHYICYLEYFREFIVGICPFIVASLGWLLEKNNWNLLAPQYRKIESLFSKTIEYIGNPLNTLDSKRQIIKELMVFAHDENAEWDSIRRDSRPEPMT